MIPTLQAVFPELSLRQVCPLLGISRSGVYAARQRPAVELDVEAVAVRDAIERLVLAFPGYGYRRVTQALRREGWTINAKRVRRVMRDESLLCQLKRRFVRTTDSRHGLGSYPNRLREQVLTGPNQAWVADITYIRLPTMFCYLAAILDAWSRRCVGWELSRHIDTELTLVAPRRRLGAVAPHRHRTDRDGAGARHRRSHSGAGSDPPFRPRGAVRQQPLCRAPRAGWRPDQHGRHRQRL